MDEWDLQKLIINIITCRPTFGMDDVILCWILTQQLSYDSCAFALKNFQRYIQKYPCYVII